MVIISEGDAEGVSRFVLDGGGGPIVSVLVEFESVSLRVTFVDCVREKLPVNSNDSDDVTSFEKVPDDDTEDASVVLAEMDSDCVIENDFDLLCTSCEGEGVLEYESLFERSGVSVFDFDIVSPSRESDAE